MERRQRLAANGLWDRPHYGNKSAQHPPRFRPERPQCPSSRSAPRHGEPQPSVYYADGGVQRSAPWESRPPYEAGRPGCSPHEGSEQRTSYRESRVDFTQRGYHEPHQHGGPQGVSQFRLPRLDVFPQGGTRPGMPLHAPIQPVRTQGVVSQAMQRADDLYGNFISEGLQSSIIRKDGSVPNIPQHGAPEPPQDGMQYNAALDGTRHSLHVQTPEPGVQGRPQQMIPASSQEHEHRKESQDVTRRLNSHENIYQSGERHGGPQHVSDEPQGPLYSERPLPRSEHPEVYQPDLFHHGGPSGGPDSALSPYSSSHLGGRQPAGFQHDLPHNRSNLQLTYQNDASQPGVSHRGSQAGLYNLNTPPVPDAFNYRAPSPGIQQFSTQLQLAPMQNPPQQSHYHLPPIHGNLPNSPYAFHPPVDSAFSGSLEEGDLRHRNHPHHLLSQQQSITHQDRRQGLDPLMPSGMAGGRHFEHDALFPQHEVPDGHRDPNMLLQHGSPFVAQPIPHTEDTFMHLDRQTDIEKGGSADKDAFMQWLSSFLSCRRKKPSTKPDAMQACSIAAARGLIYGALRLVSQLDSLCQALESSNEAGEPWTRDYEKAADIRVDLEKRLKELEEPGYIQGVKRKLDRVCKKRQRRRQAAEEEEEQATERSAEKEASIDMWRMQCIQKVEERKRERELKVTADSVLGEVRKKQNDVKKMLDVLKSLEKLRKLRKEAAGRKGVCPPSSADEKFTNRIKRLRTMVHKRSVLYDAEEKTLRVILEGEQEEERQRENDKRLKKEKEKTLQKQRELDSILFGDTEPLPSLHPLQPFRQYYLQAEHSVVSLVQIRHEWDQFLVPPDHPDGSSIPRGWLVPTPPFNDTWATALTQSD